MTSTTAATSSEWRRGDPGLRAGKETPLRFYPTPEQAAELSRTFGCVRKVYNLALEARTAAWDQRQERVTYLQSAFARFWDKQARYPRFKSRKKSRASAEYTRSAFRYRDGQLHLAKMTAPLAVVWSRPLPDGAEPSTVTVSRDPAGRWFVALLCHCAVEPHPASATVAGVDAGITSLVTLSTGEKIASPRHERRDRARLAVAQRRMARTQKGSANRDKARLRVARVHARICDRRKDFLHKLTTRLVRENQAVVIEDLSVRNMVRNHHRDQHQSRRAGGAGLRSWRQTSAGIFPGGRPAVKQEPRRVTAGIPVLHSGRSEVNYAHTRGCPRTGRGAHSGVV